MSRDAHDCDVLIAGAGLVGLALAPALAKSHLALALADRNALTMPDAPGGDDDWDARVYAISPGSAAFLRSQGAWQAIATDRLTPIESMRVEGDAGSVLTFSAYDMGVRALAWIVEERALRAALIPRVHASGAAVFGGSRFETLSFSTDRALLGLTDAGSIAARLVIGADGARSWVREAAGVRADLGSYRQTAVVANFACERPHRGRAFQWFRGDGGILAWLPLPGRRVSMVWSAPDPLAVELLAHDPATLAKRVASAGRFALGDFGCITAALGFPLQRVAVRAPIAHRIALVGDAAHGVHPLAGQGVNLGFGDADALAAVLRERGPLNDAGAPILLERYSRRRAEPVAAMQYVTDGLARLFARAEPWARSVRNAGMDALEGLPHAKRMLARAALR